jgi:hypothetical protein
MFILAALVFLIIIIALFGVIFFLKKKNDELTFSVNSLKLNTSDWSVYSNKVISQAAEKAQDIVSQAEIEALKNVSEKDMEAKLFEQHFSERLDRIVEDVNVALLKRLDQMELQFGQSIKQAEAKYEQFLQQVEKQNMSLETEVEEEMKGKINQSLVDFEQKMSDFFARAEKESLNSLALEIKSARELIESYKAQQLQIIDENIVAIIEKTVALVLKQKLTLKEQLDLVYEALEKAKSDRFLV